MPDKKIREPDDQKTEAQIDEALEETFPASDPPSYAVPVTPARTTPAAPREKAKTK